MMSEKKRFEFYSDEYLVGIIDTASGKKLNHFATIDLLNEQDEEIKELQLQLEAFKDKLCELGVSDVKLYGKRYYTGLEEWLE